MLSAGAVLFVESCGKVAADFDSAVSETCAFTSTSELFDGAVSGCVADVWLTGEGKGGDSGGEAVSFFTVASFTPLVRGD